MAVPPALSRTIASVSSRNGSSEGTAVPVLPAVVGTEDRITPPTAQRRMARRAGSTIVETPAGHVSMLAAPDVVAGVIVAAAESVG
ncbi:alpha/beta fold hydrolase [Leifsonia sp. LS1]|uniref:alpha/beta fold hydrolase n=1 Tax=Leifsonia sp. LS1 TaxID=2828483 RepID=UPI0035B61C7A